jgi:hypothetical protein
MDSALLPSSTSGTKGSFWKSKEGKFGMGVTVLLGAGALYLLYLALPFLITLAQNTLQFALLCVALFALVYIVLDKDVRTFVWYLYKAGVRALRNLLINTDPVGIIENYIAHLRKQFTQLEEKIQLLSGARKKLEDAIERNKVALEDQLDQATAAQKKKLSAPEIAVYTNQAGRLKNGITKFQAMLTKLIMLYNLLNDIRKACKVIIADKENQVNQIKTERDTMNIGFSAFKSAVSILKGDPDKKYFYDEAMEAIQNDISMKSGIIDQYLVESGEILQSIDLQNASFEEKGSRLLEKWQKEGMAALLTDGSEKIPSLSGMAISAQYEVVPSIADNGNNKYKSLLK